MSRLDTRQGDEWISSDAQILKRLVQRPVPGGMEVSLGMPFGEPCVAVLKKMNINSANNYCALVRETYIERIKEQKAASAQRLNELEAKAEQEGVTEVLPVPQEVVGLDYMDEEAVAARIVELADRARVCRDEATACEVEGATLLRIAEVLNDAFKNATETSGSVLQPEVERDSEGVAGETRPSDVHSGGEVSAGEASEEGERLDLPTPDSDTEGSGVDHEDQPAVPVGGGAKNFKPF